MTAIEVLLLLVLGGLFLIGLRKQNVSRKDKTEDLAAVVEELREFGTELAALGLDLSEVEIGVDLDYQLERYDKLTARYKGLMEDLHKAINKVIVPDSSTQIHGGGTGND